MSDSMLLMLVDLLGQRARDIVSSGQSSEAWIITIWSNSGGSRFGMINFIAAAAAGKS